MAIHLRTIKKKNERRQLEMDFEMERNRRREKLAKGERLGRGTCEERTCEQRRKRISGGVRPRQLMA